MWEQLRECEKDILTISNKGAAVEGRRPLVFENYLVFLKFSKNILFVPIVSHILVWTPLASMQTATCS